MGDIFEKVKAADDLVREVVHVDEWDVDIEVRTISAAGVDAIDTDSKTYRADMIIAASYVPGTDEFAFPNTPEAREVLMNKNARATGRLVNAIMRINGMNAEGREELKKG